MELQKIIKQSLRFKNKVKKQNSYCSWTLAHSIKNYVVNSITKFKKSEKIDNYDRVQILAFSNLNGIGDVYSWPNWEQKIGDRNNGNIITFLNAKQIVSRRMMYVSPNYKLWPQIKQLNQLNLLFVENYILKYPLTLGKLISEIYNAWLLIFKMVKPKVLLLYAEYGVVEHIGSIVAKERGVTIVAIQHGIIHPSHNGYQYGLAEHFVTPDFLLTWGSLEKNIINYPKISKCEVIPMGSPQHDFLAHFSFSNSEIYSKYKLDKTKKIILWATQGHDSIMNSSGEWEKTIDEVYKAAKRLPFCQFIIKLHPGENQLAIKYLRYSFCNGINIKIFKHEDSNIYELINISDYVITKQSTVGIEAILIGTPVINTEVMDSLDLSIYVGCPKIKCHEELINVIGNSEFNKNSKEFLLFRQRFIKKHHVNFGTATETIGNFLIERIKIINGINSDGETE